MVTTNTITYPEENRELLQREFSKILAEPVLTDQVAKAYASLDSVTKDVEEMRAKQEKAQAAK